MKSNQYQNRILQFAIILMMVFLASCAPEPDEDVVVDYTGTWTCSETTSNPASTSSYSVKLKKLGSSTTEYKIENFYNLGFNYEAAVSIGAAAISISSQTIGAGNTSFTASGSGTVNASNKLTMTYKMEDGSGAADNCSASFNKQ